MKIKFKDILVPSLLSTLTALILSFLLLPQNSGYAGLFFITLSPLLLFIFVIWTLVLLATISTKKIPSKFSIIFLLTAILQLFVIIVTVFIINSDSPAYNFNTFLVDFIDIISEPSVLIFILAVTTIYTFLLKHMLNRNLIKSQ